MSKKKSPETRSMCVTRPNLAKGTVFHAVYIPQDGDPPADDVKEECIHIYQDMPFALEVIKAHKKARLKTFKNYADAVAYAKYGQEQTFTATCNVVQEVSNFKAPKSQDLVAFRKVINSGDLETVRSTIWENPRYLINSGDTPAILHIGSRYNALHVAAIADLPQMCELILSTVTDPKFLHLLYEGTECKSNVDFAQNLLDQFLNMPDKGLHETPLHFAVKFGYKDVVRILVSYPQCDKTMQNKHDQKPVNIICSRRCQEDENLKREILRLLEDQFYVPVLRAEGNACPPSIGEPFSPSSPLNLNQDPMSPRLEISAFAGPMHQSQAVEFRKKWKTPPRCNLKAGQGDASSIMNSPKLAVRLQDTEKGLERVGRDLAEEYQVLWKEYWPFLNDFVDFRSEEGMKKLEKYLERRFEFKLRAPKKQVEHLESAMRKLINNTNADAPANCERTPEKVDEIEDLCGKFRSCSLSAQNDKIEENIDILEFYTPSSSPEPAIQNDSDDDMESAEEGSVIFIEGYSPTKLDYAVYNALSSAICSDTYPYIYRWRHDMQLVLKRDPHRFDNTRPLRRKLFANV